MSKRFEKNAKTLIAGFFGGGHTNTNCDKYYIYTPKLLCKFDFNFFHGPHAPSYQVSLII